MLLDPGPEGGTRFDAAIKAAPAPPSPNPPRPFGDLTHASIEDIDAAMRRAWPDVNKITQGNHGRALRCLLGRLLEFSGASWQERWESAGFNEGTDRVGSLLFPDDAKRRAMANHAIRTLFGLRVVQPSLLGFRANRFTSYPEGFRSLQRDPALDRLFAYVESRTDLPRGPRLHALFDICCAITVQGISLAELTPPALLHYAHETRCHGLKVGAKGDTTSFAGGLAWQILHDTGNFPSSTPPTMRALIRRGRPSIEQRVDRYEIQNEGIRQLLIDYLTRRQVDSDYTSLSGIVLALAGHFWSRIESIAPSQETLHIEQHVYEQWRETINWVETARGDRRPRTDPHGILVIVRSFYADIHSWAAEDPATWARWAAPCPIPYGELRGFKKRRRRLKERMDNRTRVLQPLLPILTESVETAYENAHALLEAGAQVERDHPFTHRGREYTRIITTHDMMSPDHIAVRLLDGETGERINITLHEDYCFWRWASLEILRLSGIRIEELVELTQLSIRQYRRPNGEVIPLLVIAPSKSDRERVIPMSAELFHIVAQIIRRLTRDGQHRSASSI
ncbi:hypothetical protein [Nocardia sp. NBC_00403]|uniref:hypothetical protein n=1 Tax=Nocardia sp. NBC_00403 TaxID=2975990 RepID=UPI002E2076D9